MLLDASVYSNVEMTGESTISFSGAAGIESWLAEEGMELIDASGTVTLDASGMLSASTYTVSYDYGPASFTLTVTAKITPASAQVTVPEDPSQFISVEDPNAPLIHERAIGMLLQAQSVSGTSTEAIVSQAGSITRSLQTTLNAFGADDSLMAQFDNTLQWVDLSNPSDVSTYTQQETFKDGVYSYSTDGGAPQTDPSVDSATIQMAVDNTMAVMPSVSNLGSLTLTDLGSNYLIEFNYLDSVADQYSSSVCGVLYEDANLLNDMASAYRTDAAGGYMGVDKITGLPYAVGLGYVGVHTIEGIEYMLTMDSITSYSLCTGAPYEALTGEPLAVEIPEGQATPLLYHVTGTNGEEMWLFGTIHVGDPRTTALPQEFYTAFQASDALAVEFDTDSAMEQALADPEMALQVAQSYYYTDGTTTADHIQDAELYETTMRVLKAIGGYNNMALVAKPTILATMIDNAYLAQSYSLSPDYGMESHLLDLAAQQNKEILSVESLMAQLEMLTGYSDGVQEMLLASSVSTSAAEYNAGVQELYELWCAGDEAALIARITEEPTELTEDEALLYQEYHKAMYTDRNAAMLEVAKDYLEGGDTVFYAVGLAHLLASDGLVNTLRNAGYTVELVAYE